jgi:5-methylcytosine-specific restriction endonuclease McrA
MPMDRSRYPKDWDAIALAAKVEVNWTCRHCGKQCIKPDTDTSKLSPSQRGQLTLTVHHADFRPENNKRENLIPLCAPCHLRAHTPRRSNVPPGQLSLDLELS